MSECDRTKESYNKFHLISNLPYNCISYLIDNNEEIWKLLKYNDYDAWKKPDLTREEKSELIYNGGTNITDYRVFMDVGQDDVFTMEATILRISVFELRPYTYVTGLVTMSMEVLSHYKINHLSNYQTRIDMITQNLLATFNGAEIGGLGRLFFDTASSRQCKVISIGQTPFKGKALFLVNNVT